MANPKNELTRQQKLFISEALKHLCLCDGNLANFTKAAAILWKINLPQQASFLEERRNLLKSVRPVPFDKVAAGPNNVTFRAGHGKS